MSEQRRDTPPTLSAHGGVRPRSPAEALEPGRAPVNPRKGRKPQSRKVSRVVRIFSGLMSTALVALLTGTTLLALIFHQFAKPGPLEVTQTVSIPRGEGRIEIARRLEREGVISSSWTFVAGYLFRSRWGTNPNMNLKAGEYEIKKNASMRDVLDTLIEGKSVLYSVTIPEGLTSKQIVERLNAEPQLTGTIETIPAEGTLLPETYSFSRNADRNEIVARMKQNQEKIIAKLWQTRDPELPVKSPEDAIILASIVEKETGRPDEREQVASVFVNRLRKDMRLQSDPTIIYGIVGGEGRLGRAITKSDIKQKTAYNTYRIDGLPPGPICNPGRAAIAATLKPATTDYIYFVATGDGGHTFSKTLKAHNEAVADWRKVERERSLAAQQQATQSSDEMVLLNEDAIPNPPSADDADQDAIVAPISEAAKTLESDSATSETASSDTPEQDTKVASEQGGSDGLKASTVPLPIRRPPQQ